MTVPSNGSEAEKAVDSLEYLRDEIEADIATLSSDYAADIDNLSDEAAAGLKALDELIYDHGIIDRAILVLHQRYLTED